MELSFKKSIIQPGVTPIENIFLDNYLPIVDEISLKVYLFLYKRLFGAYKSELSINSISNELKFSKIQVMNALKYWKDNQLLDFSLDKDGEVEKIEFVNNFALYAGGVYNELEDDLEDKEVIDDKDYFKKIESITSLSLKPYEINEILEHIEETGHDMKLVYRAYEYAKSLGKSMSVKYVIGILRSWKRDNNISNTEDLDNFLNNKDNNNKRLRKYSKNVKKYIEKEDMLTQEEKIEKIKNNKNSAMLELLNKD